METQEEEIIVSRTFPFRIFQNGFSLVRSIIGYILQFCNCRRISEGDNEYLWISYWESTLHLHAWTEWIPIVRQKIYVINGLVIFTQSETFSSEILTEGLKEIYALALPSIEKHGEILLEADTVVRATVGHPPLATSDIFEFSSSSSYKNLVIFHSRRNTRVISIHSTWMRVRRELWLEWVF